MNKKRLYFDIIFTFLLTLVILFSSFLISSYIATKEAKQNLINYSDNVADMINDGASFEDIKVSYQNVLNLRITILDNNGTPQLEINEYDKEPFEEDRLSELIKYCDSFYYKDSLTMGYEILYFVRKSDNFFIRVGLPKASIVYYSKNILIYGSIIVIVTNTLYAIIKIHNYRKDIKKLNVEINNLKRISGEDVYSEFDNVESILGAIKTSGSLIENKIEELKFQKDKTNFILNSIKEGFIVIDESKKIKSINNFAIDVLNIRKDIIDKNSLFLSLGKEFDEELNNALKNKQYFFELQLNNKFYQFFSNSIKLDWNDNTQNGIALLFFDMTENKINEKMKREFFQNASHELKTPLTTIIGYEGMIVNGLIESNDELCRANEAILKEANRMKSIIEDMLTLSNLESLELKDDIKNINVKDVVINAIEDLKYQIENKNIKLFTLCENCYIDASLDDIERMIKNLLTNAIKYSKENGSIYVNLSNKILIIKDTGIGIEGKYLNRIFERFFRVDKSRSRSQGGTGLGLAIVKHTCIKYGYIIDVKSHLGIGTEFKIKFK